MNIEYIRDEAFQATHVVVSLDGQEQTYTQEQALELLTWLEQNKERIIRDQKRKVAHRAWLEEGIA
jgi:hypothetical protein